MSNEHADSIQQMANLILRKYNYLINTFFSTVHYYYGNSFPISPFKQYRGTISSAEFACGHSVSARRDNRVVNGDICCFGSGSNRPIEDSASVSAQFFIDSAAVAGLR